MAEFKITYYAVIKGYLGLLLLSPRLSLLAVTSYLIIPHSNATLLCLFRCPTFNQISALWNSFHQARAVATRAFVRVSAPGSSFVYSISATTALGFVTFPVLSHSFGTATTTSSNSTTSTCPIDTGYLYIPVPPPDPMLRTNPFTFAPARPSEVNPSTLTTKDLRDITKFTTPWECLLLQGFLDMVAPPPLSDEDEYRAGRRHIMDLMNDIPGSNLDDVEPHSSLRPPSTASNTTEAKSAGSLSDRVGPHIDLAIRRRYAQERTAPSNESAQSALPPSSYNNTVVGSDEAGFVLEWTNAFFQRFYRASESLRNQYLPAFGVVAVTRNVSLEEAILLSRGRRVGAGGVPLHHQHLIDHASSNASTSPAASNVSPQLTFISLRNHKGAMTVDDVRGVVNDVDALLLSAKGIFNSLEIFQRTVVAAAAIYSNLLPRAISDDTETTSAPTSQTTSSSSSAQVPQTSSEHIPITDKLGTEAVYTPHALEDFSSVKSIMSSPSALWNDLSSIQSSYMAVSGEPFLVPYETGFEANMASKSIAFANFEELTDEHLKHMYSGYHTKSKGRLYRKYLLTCPRVVFHEMIHCIQHIAKQIDKTGPSAGPSWSAEHDASVTATTGFWFATKLLQGEVELPGIGAFGPKGSLDAREIEREMEEKGYFIESDASFAQGDEGDQEGNEIDNALQDLADMWGVEWDAKEEDEAEETPSSPSSPPLSSTVGASSSTNLSAPTLPSTSSSTSFSSSSSSSSSSEPSRPRFVSDFSDDDEDSYFRPQDIKNAVQEANTTGTLVKLPGMDEEKKQSGNTNATTESIEKGSLEPLGVIEGSRCGLAFMRELLSNGAAYLSLSNAFLDTSLRAHVRTDSLNREKYLEWRNSFGMKPPVKTSESLHGAFKECLAFDTFYPHPELLTQQLKLMFKNRSGDLQKHHDNDGFTVGEHQFGCAGSDNNRSTTMPKATPDASSCPYGRGPFAYWSLPRTVPLPSAPSTSTPEPCSPDCFNFVAFRGGISNSDDETVKEL